MTGLAANLPFGLAAGMGLSCWLVKSKLFTTFPSFASEDVPGDSWISGTLTCATASLTDLD